MPGTKINDYSIGDSDLTNMQLTLDAIRKGMHQVSLTNDDTTDVPAIAAGSVVEINGGYFKFPTEESISGSPSDGDVYIKCIPSGSSVTAEFTNTEPEWSHVKQGFYSPTAGEENHRYIGGCTKSGTSYAMKYLLLSMNSLGVKIFSNKIQFAFFNQVEFGELIMGDLKMYGYGDPLVIYDTSSAGSMTKTFVIKKPCFVYVYCVSRIEARIDSTQVSTWTSLAQGSSGPLSTFLNLRPGNYRLINGSYGDMVLSILSVEGVNELSSSNQSLFFEEI